MPEVERLHGGEVGNGEGRGFGVRHARRERPHGGGVVAGVSVISTGQRGCGVVGGHVGGRTQRMRRSLNRASRAGRLQCGRQRGRASHRCRRPRRRLRLAFVIQSILVPNGPEIRTSTVATHDLPGIDMHTADGVPPACRSPPSGQGLSGHRKGLANQSDSARLPCS